MHVHADAESDELARSLAAAAFTTGSDIFFRADAYAPATSAGLELLAHEAVHTLQQAAGPVSGSPAPGGVRVSDPADRFEQAARTAADRIVGAGASAAPGAAAPAAATSAASALSGEVVVQRALPKPKEFKKDTSLTLSIEGKTLTEINRRLKEYYALLEQLNIGESAVGESWKGAWDVNDARQRAKMRIWVKNHDRGALRLEQVLVHLEADAKFWLDSHVDDGSDAAKHRRKPVNRLYEAAGDELNAIRRWRSADPAAPSADKPNEFLATMQGSASSILDGLGTAIGLAVPNPGDSVEAKVQVKIPCEPTGIGYVGFRIRALALRQDGKATKVRADIAVLGGARVPGLTDVGGALGVLLEAQGKRPKEAMRLRISYGWYRWIREQRLVPREVANFMWGGSIEPIGWTRSEQWAANVETKAFKRLPNDPPLSSGVGTKATKNEYVRIAALAGASVEAGVADVAKLGARIEAQAGTHWDQASLNLAIKADKKRGSPLRGDIGEPLPKPKERAVKAGPALSTPFGGVAVTFSADVGPMKGEVTASLALMARLQKENLTREKKLPAGYISVSGMLLLDTPEVVPVALPWIFRRVKAELAPKIAAAIASLTSTSLASRYDDDETSEGLAMAETSLVSALGAIDPDAPVSMLAGSMVAASMLAPVKLRVDLAAGYQLGARKDGWTIEFSISQVTGPSVDVSLVGLGLLRRERLMRFVYTFEKSQKKKAADDLATKVRALNKATAAAQASPGDVAAQKLETAARDAVKAAKRELSLAPTAATWKGVLD